MDSFPYQVLLILTALSCLLEFEEGCSLKTPLNGCTLISIEIAVKNFQHEGVLKILTMTLAHNTIGKNFQLSRVV